MIPTAPAFSSTAGKVLAVLPVFLIRSAQASVCAVRSFFIFSKEFAVLIVVGFVIAVPFAWYMTSQFLQTFQYRIDLGPWVFLAGIGITSLIAFVTVGYKSLKAATVNPVDSLKCE